MVCWLWNSVPSVGTICLDRVWSVRTFLFLIFLERFFLHNLSEYLTFSAIYCYLCPQKYTIADKSFPITSSLFCKLLSIQLATLKYRQCVFYQQRCIFSDTSPFYFITTLDKMLVRSTAFLLFLIKFEVVVVCFLSKMRSFFFSKVLLLRFNSQTSFSSEINRK